MVNGCPDELHREVTAETAGEGRPFRDGADVDCDADEKHAASGAADRGLT